MASKLTSLKLADYSDRELLAIVDDLADDDGLVSRSVLLDRLAIDNERAANCVGTRFGYMTSKGWVTREIIDGEGHYSLTAVGGMIVSGKMTKTARAALDRMNDGDLVMLTRYVTGRYRQENEPMAVALKREWTRGAYHRRNGS